MINQMMELTKKRMKEFKELVKVNGWYRHLIALIIFFWLVLFYMIYKAKMQ